MGNWELVLATLIRQNDIAVSSPHSLRWWEGISYASVWIPNSSNILKNVEIVCNPYVIVFWLAWHMDWL